MLLVTTLLFAALVLSVVGMAGTLFWGATKAMAPTPARQRVSARQRASRRLLMLLAAAGVGWLLMFLISSLGLAMLGYSV